MEVHDVAKLLMAMSGSSPGRAPASASRFIGQHVVVRTYSAGVHVGTLESHDGTNVVLSRARRLWQWAGAFTLSEVSQTGITQSGSRMSVEVPLIELTQAIEIIPTTETARKTYEVVSEQ